MEYDQPMARENRGKVSPAIYQVDGRRCCGGLRF